MKPRWLREHEKQLKREYRVNYGAPNQTPGKEVKVTRIEIEPEKTAKTLILRILQKFGL